MKKGFVADSQGRIKYSWIWVDDDKPCPYPHHSQIADGDKVYEVSDTDYDAFHNEFHTRIHERLVTRDHLSTVSINSGRIVLDNLVKREANEIV